MKKTIIALVLLILVIFYFQTEQAGITISSKTEMESSLENNVLTKPYLTDNLLSVTLTPKKDYANLSLNITSNGLNFEPLQPVNYFDLTKKRVFKFKISVKNEFKEGSIVDYSVNIVDNKNSDSIIMTKSFDYEVGKVRFYDKIKSIFWGFMLLIIIVLILGRKKLGNVLELFSKFS